MAGCHLYVVKLKGLTTVVTHPRRYRRDAVLDTACHYRNILRALYTSFKVDTHCFKRRCLRALLCKVLDACLLRTQRINYSPECVLNTGYLPFYKVILVFIGVGTRYHKYSSVVLVELEYKVVKSLHNRAD